MRLSCLSKRINGVDDGGSESLHRQDKSAPDVRIGVAATAEKTKARPVEQVEIEFDPATTMCASSNKTTSPPDRRHDLVPGLRVTRVIEDHPGALSTGNFLHPSSDVLDATIDHMIGTSLPCNLETIRRSRHGYHLGPDCATDLHAGGAEAAPSPHDHQCLASL